MSYRVKIAIVPGALPRPHTRDYIESTERLRVDDKAIAEIIRRDAQAHLGTLYATVTVEEVTP